MAAAPVHAAALTALAAGASGRAQACPQPRRKPLWRARRCSGLRLPIGASAALHAARTAADVPKASRANVVLASAGVKRSSTGKLFASLARAPVAGVRARPAARSRQGSSVLRALRCVR